MASAKSLPATPSASKRNFSAPAALLLAGCLAALVLAEGLLRLVDAKAGNYQGSFLGGEMVSPRRKILILGDSFLVSQGDHAHLYEYLSARLRAGKIQLKNTAEPGFGPIDYWVQLQTFGPSYHPDTVALFYYAGNDLTNVQYRSDWREQVKVIFKPWLNRSALFHFLNEKRNWRAQKRAETKRLPGENAVNPWFRELSVKKPRYILDNLLMDRPENEQAWQKAQNYLLKIHQWAAGHHARLVLIMIPSTAQVNPSHFGFYSNLGFQLDERTLHESRPQELLHSFCREQGINCLDLLPAFRGAGFELYRGDDDHLNEEGGRLAAEKTAEFLLSPSG